MSKVAINGRTMPLAPIAGGLAGIVAFIAFLLIPQGILESLVWQTRLDIVFPAAQPPLGVTARILVAVAAALLAAALTAFFAVKFAKIGSTRGERRRRRPLRTDGVEGILPATLNDDLSDAQSEMPATPIADVVVEPAPMEEKKMSILARLRRRKNDDDIEIEDTPRLRRRDFHPDAPARRPLFADVELPGKTLDSVNMTEEPARPPVSQPTTPVHERASPQLPAWAYEEDCDLIGNRTPAATPAPQEDITANLVPSPALKTPAFETAATPDALAATTDTLPESSIEHRIRPTSAGMADWEGPSAFDNYVASLIEEKVAQYGGPKEEVMEQAVPHSVADTYDNDDAISAPETVELESVDAETTEPVIAMDMPERSQFDPIAAQDFAEPAELVVPDHNDVDDYTPFERITSQLANTAVGDSSVDELMIRLEQGMARRTARRAQQAERNRIEAQTRAAVAVEMMPTAEQESGANEAVSEQPESEPVAPTNPFAAIDPLANLADKEAEVDEALRAALSTLERMNRRVG